MNQLDPQFSIPNVYTLKYGALTSLMLEVNNQIEQELSKIPYCNISLDLWSDAIMRSFNAVICQGINDDWELKVIPIAFQHLSGSHTNVRIKQQYNEILSKFKLQEKIYKIVTDQASNMKTAFGNIVENIFPLVLAPDNTNYDVANIISILLQEVHDKDNMNFGKHLLTDNDLCSNDYSNVDSSTPTTPNSSSSLSSQNSSQTNLGVNEIKITDFYAKRFDKNKAIQLALQMDEISEETFEEISEELDKTLLDADDVDDDDDEVEVSQVFNFFV